MNGQDSIKKLRKVIFGFVLLLAIPALVLFSYSTAQLKNEAESVYTKLAKSLADRIDSSIESLIKREEARSFSDYRFLSITGSEANNYQQQSVLASFPIRDGVPGLRGHFQIDPDQKFTTPILPEDERVALDYGVTTQELEQRKKLSNELYDILSENRLVAKLDREQTPFLTDTAVVDPRLMREDIMSGVLAYDSMLSSVPESSFEELEIAPSSRFESIASYDSIDEFKWDKQVSISRQAPAKAKKLAKAEKSVVRRKEQNILPETKEVIGRTQSVKVSMFENEVESFKFSFLSSGHLILYRSAYHEGRKYIQGLILDQEEFIKEYVLDPFKESSLSQVYNLLLVYSDQVFKSVRVTQDSSYISTARTQNGAFSVRYSLSAPLDKFELVYSADELPLGPQSNIIVITAFAFLFILLGGCYLIYRVGLKQIEINNQQRNFVSSVSHELKTPLTSIRMYGEALSKGWATEEKKVEYYDYILKESERLSRLIHNILQLSQAERGELELNNKAVYVGELVELINAKISGGCKAKGFELSISCNDGLLDKQVSLDKDAFTQVAINLIDNGMKFSKDAERKEIEILIEEKNGLLEFGFRDFGPGIAKEHAKKVFDYFYRAGNELTRTTKGTGIGLALVKYLVSGMNAKITLENKKPGALFIVSFKRT